MSSGDDRITCSQCGNDYQSITIHWARSSSCSPERYSPEQVEILEGLIMTGGTFSWSSNNAAYQLTTSNKQLLEFAKSHFPLLSSDITMALDKEEAEASLRDRMDIPDDQDVDASPVYMWYTSTLPHVTDLYAKWTDEDENRDLPNEYRASPLTLAVAYAAAGRLDTDGSSTDRQTAAFTVSATPLSTDEWLSVLDQFTPYAQRQGDHDVIYLREPVQFFKYINSNRVFPGDEIPRADTKWPRDLSQLRGYDVTTETCPSCDDGYANLAKHWVTSPCDPPSFSEPVLELLTGFLVVRGTVGSRDTDRPFLSFTVSSEPFADWIANDVLGILSPGVSEIPAGTKEITFNGETTITETSTRYRVKTRRHPALTQFADWYSNGGKTIPEDDITRTPLLIRGMYAMKGRLSTVLSTTPAPVMSIGAVDASDEFFQELFKPFAPEVRHRTSNRVLICHDADALFEYIGRTPTPGCGEKWLQDADDRSTRTATKCPSCGNWFMSISTHWYADRTDCDYPAFTDRQEHVLTGVMLCGAGCHSQPANEYPSVYFETKNPAVGAYVTAALNPLATTMTRRGRSGSDEQVAVGTRSHPYIETVCDAWNGGGDDASPPENVELTPEAFAVVFGRFAEVQDGSGEEVVVISTGRLTCSHDRFCKLLDDSDAPPYTSHGSKVIFNDAPAVYEWVKESGWDTPEPYSHSSND